MKKFVHFAIALAMTAIASSAFAQPKCNHQAAIGMFDNTKVVKTASSSANSAVRTGTK